MNSSDVLKLIKSRRSIRKFTKEKLLGLDIWALIEAGIHAPTGSNTQCYNFLITENRKDIEFLASKKIPIVSNASGIILVLADLSKCGYMTGNRKEIFKDLFIQDCAMASQNIMLMAQALELGSCMIQLNDAWPTSEEIRNYFDIPHKYCFQGMILLGYPNEKVNVEKDTHQGRAIKREPIKNYILNWRS